MTSPKVRTPTVSVVIPTYRRPADLTRLLTSVYKNTILPLEVLVINNDSEPITPTISPEIRNIKVINAAYGMNLAAARNRGWLEASGDLIFFVDDDNQLAPDCIAALLSALSLSTVGVVGPVMLDGNTGTTWCAGVRRGKWTGRTLLIGRGQARPKPESISPAILFKTLDLPNAFMVPRPILVNLGGFDELAFPIHYDEADFAQRLRYLGKDAFVVPRALTEHFGFVGSDIGTEFVRAFSVHGHDRAMTMARSRVWYARRHTSGFPRLSQLGPGMLAWILILSVSLARKFDLPMEVRRHTWRAVIDGLIAGYTKPVPGPPKVAVS